MHRGAPSPFSPAGLPLASPVGPAARGLKYCMPNLRSSITAVALLAAPMHTIAAQVVPLPGDSPAPTIWVSASGALLNLQSFHGGAGGEGWNWGDAVQLRGGVERALRRDMSFGVTGSYARVPLTVTGGQCNGCQGKATAWQGMATLRLGGGGGIGFHSVFEASAGAAGFTNFVRDGAAVLPGPLTTAHRSIVPAIGASYGVGYGLIPGLELSLVQEVGIFIYGPSESAPSGASSTPRFQSTRLTLRYGLPQSGTR